MKLFRQKSFWLAFLVLLVLVGGYFYIAEMYRLKLDLKTIQTNLSARESELRTVRANLNVWENDREHRASLAEELTVRSAKKLKLRHLNMPPGLSSFSKEQVFYGNEQTWNEIYARLQLYYLANETELANCLPNFDEPIRKLAFWGTVVGNMWRIGSPTQPDSSVETFHKQHSSDRIIDAKDYIKSPYGDCNDFATFLYMMLSLDKFQVVHVGTEDHIFLETYVKGVPYIIDAMNGFLVQDDIKDFLNQGAQLAEYLIFPLQFGNQESPLFKPYQEAIRFHYILTRGRVRLRQNHNYSHWDRFEIWLALNGTELDGDVRGLIVNGQRISIVNGELLFKDL